MWFGDVASGTRGVTNVIKRFGRASNLSQQKRLRVGDVESGTWALVCLTPMWLDLGSKWVRLAPNGTHPLIFQMY